MLLVRQQLAWQQAKYTGCRYPTKGMPAMLEAPLGMVRAAQMSLSCGGVCILWLASKVGPCTLMHGQCSCACRTSCPSGCWAPAAWSTWT